MNSTGNPEDPVFFALVIAFPVDLFRGLIDRLTVMSSSIVNERQNDMIVYSLRKRKD